MWIHEQTNWTDFSWDNQKLVSKLNDIRHRQGRLLGKMDALGFEVKSEACLNTITNDIVNSSAIEGENLKTDEVRSSIARRLGIRIAGMVPASRHVEGVVEMMLDATQSYFKPLTKKRLFDWQAALFPTSRSGMHSIIVGDWRDDKNGPMQVVSGPIGHEKVHFEAPSADKIDHEMAAFLLWFEHRDNTDPLIRAGIAHFWFVTIHPFEDGNGRIARAIGDMALARADNTPNRFYSLSTQLEHEKKDYYKQLERQQRGTSDITGWLGWFLDCLGRAIANAEETVNKIILKAQLWNKINQNTVNERQRFIINRMLEDGFKGFMNTSKYAKLVKCSTDTALRDIQDLKSKAVFIQNPSKGRSTSYRLTNTI